MWTDSAAASAHATVKTTADRKAAVRALRAALAKKTTPAEAQMGNSLKVLATGSAAGRD